MPTAAFADFTLAGSDADLCTFDLPVRTVLKCVAAQDGIPPTQPRGTLCLSVRGARNRPGPTCRAPGKVNAVASVGVIARAWN